MTKEEIVRRFFEKDEFAKKIGAEIVEVNEERAVIKATTGKDCLNADGSAQGGMLYAAADFAFAVHANFLHPKTVTQGGQIRYVLAAKTPFVTATAREIVRSGRNTVNEVIVRDAEENVLCVCSFNGFVKEIAWEELAKE